MEGICKLCEESLADRDHVAFELSTGDEVEVCIDCSECFFDAFEELQEGEYEELTE